MPNINENMPDLDLLQSTTKSIIDGIMHILPAIFILIVGWLAAKFIAYLIAKILNVSKFDNLAARFNVTEMFEKANISLSPSQMIGKFVYYTILLLFFVMATDHLGWTVVSEQISRMINLIPPLLIAIIIFLIGVYFASFLRDVIDATTSSLGISAGKFISSFVFYFLVALVSITALEQISIDTSIIKQNLVLFIGAILLAGSISYGFASRHILTNMLATFFSRKTFEVGQIIQVDDIVGEIVQIDGISVVIQTETDKIVMPSQDLINNRIRIIEN